MESQDSDVHLNSILTEDAFLTAGLLGPIQPGGLKSQPCTLIWGTREWQHTDLLIMAKQLGDQGSLSKDLQEKEGVGYRRARPGLGFSDSFPPKLDSGSERFCLASSGMGSSLLGLALLRMCTLCSSW